MAFHPAGMRLGCLWFPGVPFTHCAWTFQEGLGESANLEPSTKQLPVTLQPLLGDGGGGHRRLE